MSAGGPGDDLRGRVARTIAEADELLDTPVVQPAEDLEAIRMNIAAVQSQLERIGRAGMPAGGAAAAHADALARLRARYQSRFRWLEEAELALDGLREITAPATILTEAPATLCRHSRLRRVVLGLVKDVHLIAEAVCFADDSVAGAKALEALRAEPLRLEHPVIETELMRRRRATIVHDAAGNPRVSPAAARIMKWQSYVAAPLLVGGEVVGAIHADAGESGRALDVLDGDVLWAFARGLGELYETASLRRSLRGQREHMRAFVEWLTARSLELSETSIALDGERPHPPAPPGGLDGVGRGANVDDAHVFGELLTRRELEVLRLLARGASNSAIAADLVISQATVKFHVVNVLRKLHVANRAGAVARYHRLVTPAHHDS